MKRISLLTIGLIVSLSALTQTINTYGEFGEPIQYGIRNLEQFISVTRVDNPNEANLQLLISNQKNLTPEGYLIKKSKGVISVIGADRRGIMYGLLEIADQLKYGTSWDDIQEKEVIPRFPFRAIKFNLPYMAYRSHASIAQHSATCRDLDFWEKYLDMMVQNRYNALSLWSLHLFHYMVIPESFPEASQFNEVEMADWKNLWTTIFKMAKERGIETYIINWNTFTSPSFARVHNPELGWYNSHPWHFGSGDTSKITEKYTREIIRQVIDEYPDLTGLGITLGERMGDQTVDERRAWLDRTIFAGMNDASRKIKFVYRAPLSANSHSGGSTSEENDLRTRQQIERLDTDGPVWLEFKYNWSHGHSSPNLFIVHGGKLTDKYKNPVPTDYKYIWTIRNEDFFVHRWAQPDFVRQFIKNNGQAYVGGCFIGSEVFIPALDYTSKDGRHKTWDYSFERLWQWYSVWGNLLYDEATPDEKFANELEVRYGYNQGKRSLEAWKLASKVPLHFASFHQGRNDLTLYTEGFCGFRENRSVDFFDIERFINHPVLDTIRYINIADYIKQNKKVKKGIISPLALADSLDFIHDQCLGLVELIADEDISPTTKAELADITAWAWYAKYFADKIRAGIALAEYRINGIDQREEALKYLNKCVTHWSEYAKATTRFHTNSFIFHTKENFDWYGMLDYVKRDLSLAAMSNEAKKKADGIDKIGGYLFAHMTNDDYGALYYSMSVDGRNWTQLNEGKRVFDQYRGHPDIITGHDGRYYLTGNPPEKGRQVKIWTSEDYLTWTPFVEFKPDMSDLPEFNEPTYWHGAPKMYYDKESRKYIITWHSATVDRNEVDPDIYWGSMRTLFVTTYDFQTFTKAKKLFDYDMATIDVIIRKVGRKYYAILKDEKAPSMDWPTGKSIRIAESNNVDGPFDPPGPSISPNFREAPMLITDPTEKELFLYYEQYPGVQYEMATTSDIRGFWRHEYGETFAIPGNTRHGCMVALSKEDYERIAAKFSKDEATQSYWLYAGFKDPGDKGIWFSTSTDGLKWHELNNDQPWIALPEGMPRMRDPFITKDPRVGYHMIWTIGNQRLGYAHSNDLVHWSPPRTISVMADNPHVLNVWAPEMIYDNKSKSWFIYWSSTVDGQFPETEGQVKNNKNHRIYYMTTDDFHEFSAVKLFYDPGYPVIDATLHFENGKYTMIVKDERDIPLKKQLKLTTSENILGPWQPLSEPMTESWTEGPSIMKLADKYILYFDHYNGGSGMRALESHDLKTWIDISDQVLFPEGSKHGSFIRIDAETYNNLKKAEN